jgi:hypothetical protein
MSEKMTKQNRMFLLEFNSKPENNFLLKKCTFETENNYNIFILHKISNYKMDSWIPSIVGFIVETIVSMVIVYFVTKLFGETVSIGKAFVTAIAGAIVYTVTYVIIGNGLLAAAVAGIIWLLLLKALYNIGWIKALATAAVIWIIATIVSFVLPTLPGPV